LLLFLGLSRDMIVDTEESLLRKALLHIVQRIVVSLMERVCWRAQA
jgi:hypothetical protein